MAGSTTIQMPSAAVLAARARRETRFVAKEAEIQWFIKEVSETVELTMLQRVKLATGMVMDRVVRNISRPVTKAKGPMGGNVVLDRSKPGEYPKAETTQLMKTIFKEVVKRPGEINGYIGTPLDYGVILELKMDRSFLVRTLQEESDNVRKILTGPIKGG